MLEQEAQAKPEASGLEEVEAGLGEGETMGTEVGPLTSWLSAPHFQGLLPLLSFQIMGPVKFFTLGN